MEDHNYRLKWNEFENNLSVSFQELREDKDFFDVSLVCDDTQLQAHKLILSACSPFFKNLLKSHPHQHPLIYLRGIKARELQQVLNFMYLGEVSVDQQDLTSFLLVSQDLKVKGLTKNKSETSSSTVGNNNNISKQKAAAAKIKMNGNTADNDSLTGSPAFKKRKLTAVQQHQPSPPPSALSQHHISSDVAAEAPEESRVEAKDSDIVFEKKEECLEPPQLAVGKVFENQNGFKNLSDGEDDPMGMKDVLDDEEEYELGEWEAQTNSFAVEKMTIPPDMAPEERKELIKEHIIKHVSGMYQCLKCGYESSYNTTIKRHVEARHFSTPGVACDYCHVVCKTSNALTTHKSKFHQIAKQDKQDRIEILNQ